MSAVTTAQPSGHLSTFWIDFDEARNVDFHGFAWVRPDGNLLVEGLLEPMLWVGDRLRIGDDRHRQRIGPTDEAQQIGVAARGRAHADPLRTAVRP